MRSEGLLSRVDAAVELQQAANQVLVRLLGARYTLGGSPAGQADRNCLWALIEYSLKWRQPLYILLPFGRSPSLAGHLARMQDDPGLLDEPCFQKQC